MKREEKIFIVKTFIAMLVLAVMAILLSISAYKEDNRRKEEARERCGGDIRTVIRKDGEKEYECK